MKRQIKNILVGFLIMTLLFVGGNATKVSAANKSWSELKEEISLFFSLGNLGRTFQRITGYQDTSYVISPCNEGKGEAVSLSLEPIEKIGKLVSSVYETEYQWYKCSSELYTGSRKIEGANASAYTTDEFEKTGIYYYFCRVNLYMKYSSEKIYIGSFNSGLFKVGFTGLPVVYVNTPDGKVITSKEEWTEGADITVVGGLEDSYSLKETTIRIKGRGNSTWDCTSKTGYTVKFEKGQNVFGLGKNKTWALVSNGGDRTLLRNRFGTLLDSTVFDDGSEWNVSHVPVELVFNGEYRGSYTIATTVRLGDKRVNVPDISEGPEKDVNGDTVSDYYDCGFIVEVNFRLDEKYNFTTKHGFPISLSDPDLDDAGEDNEAIYQHIVGVIQNAEDVLYSDSFCDDEIGYQKYIDIDSFIDYYLLEEFCNNQDGTFSQSTYIYFEPKDGKLHMTAAWDFDLSMGNSSHEEYRSSEGITCRDGWYNRLFEDPDFAKAVSDRWKELRNSVEDAVKVSFPNMVEKTRVSALMNFSKWKILGVPVWPKVDGYWKRLTYQSEVNDLYNWMLARLEYMDSVYN